MRSASPALLLFVLVLALAGFAAFVAYRFMSPSYASSAVVDVDAPTPRESLETLLRLRAAGDYDGMKAWIVPARSEAVARTLRSIDAFLAADAELRRAVRDEIALGIAQSLDLSALAERLEVFSRHVELLHETVQGDAAVVSFQIDRKVPLRDARLALVGGRWLYDPGAGYRDDLPEAFDLLTRGVRELLAELRSDRWTADELQMRPEILAAALREKLEPGLRRLRSGGGEEGPPRSP